MGLQVDETAEMHERQEDAIHDSDRGHALRTLADAFDVGEGKISPDQLSELIRKGSLDALLKQAPAQFQAGKGEPAYAPDLEVYRPDPANDFRSNMYESLKKGKSSLSVSVWSHGMNERVTMNRAQSKQFAKATIKERGAFLAAAVTQQRWMIAQEAVKHILASPSVPIRNVVSPIQEAHLRGFGLLEDKTLLAEDVPALTITNLREGAAGVVARNNGTDLVKLREDIFNGLMSFNPAGFMAPGISTAPYLDYEVLPNWGYGTAQQVLISDVWDEQAKAEYAYRHDPIGKKAVHAIRDFTLGRGVRVKFAKSEKLQTVLDEYWKRNRMNERLKQWSIVTSKLGEIFLRRYRLGQGKVQHRSVRADTIVEIVTDSENFEDVSAYIQAYQTRYISTFGFDVPDKDESHYVLREIPAKEIIHRKINCDDSDIRGRSDLFCALPWMKAMRDYLTTVVQKEQTSAAFIYDYTVKGGLGDMQRIENSLPKGKQDPGGHQIHNDAVEIQVLKADPKNSTGQNSPYEGLLNHCAIATEVPREYLGSGARNTRANTLVAVDPTTKRFGERQDWTKDLLEAVVEDIIAEAIRFDATLATEETKFKVIFPAIMKADAETRIKLITRGRSLGVISHKTASESYYAEMDFDDVDYDAELEQIKKEGKDPFASVIPRDSMQVFNAPFIFANEEIAPEGTNQNAGVDPQDPSQPGPTPSKRGDGVPVGDIPPNPAKGGPKKAGAKKTSARGNRPSARKRTGSKTGVNGRPPSSNTTHNSGHQKQVTPASQAGAAQIARSQGPGGKGN